jgi:putative transposase
VTTKYEFIGAQKAFSAVVLICLWSAVSRSGFYDSCSRPASATAGDAGATCRSPYRCRVRRLGRHLRLSSGARGAGSRAGGVQPGAGASGDVGPRVYPCQPKSFRPVTTTPGDAAALPDLVGRDFTADAPGTKLVGDITYLRRGAAGRTWPRSLTVTGRPALAGRSLITYAPISWSMPWTWRAAITTSPTAAYCIPTG